MTERKRISEDDAGGDAKALGRKLPWGDFMERMSREIPGQVNRLFPRYHYHHRPDHLHPLDPVSALSDLIMTAAPSPGRVAKTAINMVPRTYGDLLVGFDPALREEEALAREGLAVHGITNPGVARSGLGRLIKDRAQEYLDKANGFLAHQLKLPEVEKEAPLADFGHELSRDQMSEYVRERHDESRSEIAAERRQLDAEKVLDSIMRPHQSPQTMSMRQAAPAAARTPANQDVLNLYDDRTLPKRKTP